MNIEWCSTHLISSPLLSSPLWQQRARPSRDNANCERRRTHQPIYPMLSSLLLEFRRSPLHGRSLSSLATSLPSPVIRTLLSAYLVLCAMTRSVLQLARKQHTHDRSDDCYLDPHE